MKLAKTILAVALPLALSAGCALDVGSSADGLTVDTNNDFGINICGESTARWLGEAEWPVDTVIVGDMEFTKGELVSHVEQNPNDRSILMGEVAAIQLNMALGLVIPDDVLDQFIGADDVLMSSDEGVPPPVVIDNFSSLTDYNSYLGRDCLTNVVQEVETTPGIVDLRDGLVETTPGIIDVRPDIFAEN